MSSSRRRRMSCGRRGPTAPERRGGTAPCPATCPASKAWPEAPRAACVMSSRFSSPSSPPSCSGPLGQPELAPVMALRKASCWACIASNPGILVIGFIAVHVLDPFLLPLADRVEGGGEELGHHRGGLRRVAAHEVGQDVDRQDAFAPALVLGDDLQEILPREIVAGLQVDDLHVSPIPDEARDVLERHVIAGLGIVETTAGVTLDQQRVFLIGQGRLPSDCAGAENSRTRAAPGASLVMTRRAT